MRKISILAAALAVLLSAGAYAATPGLISYQGTLRKDGRLFSGTVTMEFKITDASGDTEYWSSGSTDVVVSTGLFRYPLGTPDEAAFALIAWKDITPYVRMSLDGGWLAPEPLYSSVYSLHSVTAEASTGTFTVNDGDLKLAGPAGSRGVVYTDNTVQRTAPGWAASGQHAVLTGTGYAGLGLAGPQTRLDVQAAAADSYSQFWRNSGGVIVASMSAGGTLYADAAGLRNIAGDGLGSHLATQDLNMAGRRIVSVPSLGLNAAVSLSSSSAAQHGGLYVSSHVYLASGAKYYGDGSGLSNVSGSDDLGDHTLTRNLVLGANWVSGDGGAEGLAVDAAGNVGVGQAAPGARLDVRGDADGYAQIWRDAGGVVQASMSATGVLYAAASGLRGLPEGALGDGLGNHALGQNLVAGTFWYSGDGGNEGLFVDGGGNVGVSTNAPAARLDVRGAVAGNSQIWRSAAGAAVATMTATGVLYADGSGLFNIAEADPVFAAHPAYAMLAGDRASWNTAAAWGNHAVAGYAGLAQANTFASSATFSAQHATLPGVLVSSGLVVANGSVGIGTASPLQRLDVNGAVRVGDSAAEVPGSIRYNGSAFQGYNGSDWMTLSGAYTNDNSALWAVAGNTVYTVDAASSVAIGQSAAGNSKLLVRANTDDDTENALLAEDLTGFTILKVRNDGNIGAGTDTPEARLDVLTVSGSLYSQIWRNQFNIIAASVSANGVIYADGSGLRNIAGDGLGGHTASQALNLAGNQLLNASSVTVTGPQGVGAARLALAPGVALSSAAAAFQGGVYVSTHIYLPAGARYYGDGSQLSGVSAADGLGDHTLTQDLVTGSNWITGDGDSEGLYVDVYGNAGVGSNAPAARLDVRGDQGGYIQIWRNNSGVAQATMTAAGALHADGSALRNLSAAALTAGILPDARLSANVPLLDAAANAFTGSLAVTDAGGLAAPRLALAPGVAISSSAPAFNGGVYVSSNVYVVGIASAAKYYGDGSALTGVTGSDDLGDHTLTQNLVAGANWLSGDGDGEGLRVDAAGNVGVGQDAPETRLDVRGDAGGYAQFWRDNAGVIVASMTDSGVIYADASGLRNLPAGGGADNLGDHTATAQLNLASNWLVNVSTIVGASSEPGIAFSTSLFVGGDIFAAGGAMFSNGPLVIGETIPAASLHISSVAGYAGTMVLVSTGGVPVISLTGAGGVHAAKFYGDASGLYNVPVGVGMANPAIADFNMSEYRIVNVSSIVAASTLYIEGGLRNTALAGVGDRCVYAADDGTLGVKTSDCGSGGAGGGADLDMGGYTISNVGTIGISSRAFVGNAALSASAEQVLLVNHSFQGTEIGGENVGIAVLASAEPESNLTGDETVVGGDFHARTSGDFNFPSVIAARAGAMIDGGGVVNTVSGVFVQNSQTASAGTINENYGLVILPPNITDPTNSAMLKNTALLITDQSAVPLDEGGNSYNLHSQGENSINLFDGAVGIGGMLSLPVRSMAELLAYTPTFEGEVYYCSDCSPKKLVISTGTAAGNFASVDGGTFQ
ncbi:MAG: beta strand repeat-containing protein [Elusimicrobiales bacterium]